MSLTERTGNCIDGLPYFRSFVEQSANQDSVTEASWRMGRCGLEQGRFLSVIDDEGTRNRGGAIKRVVLCSGKVYVDLIGNERRAAVTAR